MTKLADGTLLSQQDYAYDAANRVVSVLGYAVSGTTVLTPVNESYTYYRDGSMRTKTAGGVTTTYNYDGAGRLTSESSATSSISYAYDAANNRTFMVNNGTLTTYTYDANNRMLTETEGGTTKAYTYDANGNQLTGDGATYTYNARGQQTGYSKGSVTASYTYLPTGLRKSKTVGITTTNYVWDGQNMVYEYNGTNTAGGTPYYYGLTLISLKNDAYYLYNAHGDVVQLVSSTGSLGLSYNYDAFGNEVNPSATDTNTFRYASQYFDTETGTYYLRARYYEPSLGRFTQQDPIMDGLNWYVYCNNNPVVFWDPWGLAPTAEEAAAMAEHIYGYRELLGGGVDIDQRMVNGWMLYGVILGSESMVMGIYGKGSVDLFDAIEYSVVFKGTTPTNLSNWINNFQALSAGASTDMWDAMTEARRFVDFAGNKEVTFVGHSKGGGEAIAAALHTNKNAITFNAANFNFKSYGLVEGDKTGNIVNYYVKGEWLHTLINPASVGTTIWLSSKDMTVNGMRNYGAYDTSFRWKYKNINSPLFWSSHGIATVRERLQYMSALRYKYGVLIW